MDWSLLPILSATLIGFVGFCLMLAAFALIARRGSWILAMQPDPQGNWPLPRRLMVIGASLSVLFSAILSLLFLIPGGIPWNK